MYQNIDGNLAISVNDWCSAGLTYRQFRYDSQKGRLKIAERGLYGETMILLDSIKRPDRMRKIEEVMGQVPNITTDAIYNLTVDTEARAFFTSYTKPDGTPLDNTLVQEYTAKASLFETMKDGLKRQTAARAASGNKLKMCEWYQDMLQWYTRQCFDINGIAKCVKPYTNVRSLERAFKAYCNDGYKSLISGKIGNDQARVVSRSMENLFLSIWRNNDKPFVHRVWELYNEFISGTTELYDKATGEVFRPSDFCKDGKATEVSEATVWNYLKNVVNNTAVYADRNGNFDYANTLRPKNHRRLGKYSLSKISMDDVALSRKSNRGWVYKYIAVDVVSGYYFRPAYIIGKPTQETVYQTFRNMFCELVELGLPMPGELEIEHHLMQDIPWLDKLFAFTRFCQSPTEKRAEHNIRSLKWGTAKDAGHTRGRWYAKHEAYRSVRNKVDGDYTEPIYQPQTIVADDLEDIERHNNELHPLQKTYPGMTRRDVLIKNFNPNLKNIDLSYLLQFIGNETYTSIRNNDYCVVANTECELRDFNALKRLKPNCSEVTAYWLPDKDGSVNSVYLYQDGTYIGEAVNREIFDYNECAVERTEQDIENMQHQYRRSAKFDKFVKERRSEICKVGTMDKRITESIATVPLEIVLTENEQPLNYEQDEFNSEDYVSKALSEL